MKNLISMVDFVFDQGNPSNTDSQFADKVMNYANFLKQQLELWMFVPCDENGNVLEEPKWENEENDYEIQILVQEYQEAKDRVLFEGFEFKGETDFSWIFKHGKTYPVMISKRNIEYLVNIFKREIELTPTAKKQILN